MTEYEDAGTVAGRARPANGGPWGRVTGWLLGAYVPRRLGEAEPGQAPPETPDAPFNQSGWLRDGWK